MKYYNKTIIAVFLLLSLQTLNALEKKSGIKNVVLPCVVAGAELDLSQRSYETFKFQIAPDTYALEIVLSEAPADLDLFVKRGEKIESYDNVDYFAATDNFNEKIIITPLSEPSLKGGTYYLDVAYQRDSFPVVKNRRAVKIRFNLKITERKVNVESVLKPSETFRSVLSPENGMSAVFAFNVPERTPFFRIDISDTFSDIDLMVGYEKKIVTRDNYDYISESLLGKESLIIKNDAKGFVTPGTYYITVFDQVAGEYEEPFSITAGLKSLPPPALSSIRNLTPPGDEFENAMMSTVEIIGEAGKGSGCLVSRDGYILTNLHVIKNYNDKVSRDIYIAVNRSYSEPPEELFKARVVETEEGADLALLRIDSGLYGQPIPFAGDFPHFSVGHGSVKPGQPISILGYPGVGGTGSRASISLTTGIVSGFENTKAGSYIKTDAEINSGNSGGAAIDVYFNLIGLPTVIIGEDSGQIGYITPVSAIPRDWFRYFIR